MSFFGMVRQLNEADVRYVVVGGVAGVAHGSARVTNDLDICYDTAAENREALANLLASWNAYPRGIDSGLPFIMDSRTLANAQVLTLTTSQGPIDIFHSVAGVGTYAECKDGAERIEVRDVDFWALGLDALIRAKRAAGREKDVMQLRELEALRELIRGKNGG